MNLFGRSKIYSEDQLLKAMGVYTEASVQSSSVPNVMKNIVSLISKRLGQPLSGGKFSVIIKKPSGTFRTYKYIIGNGSKAIRFNFKQSGGSSSIDNIDFYTTVSAYPQLNLDVHNINIVQLIDFIVKVILKGKPGMTADVDSSGTQSIVNEAIELYDEAKRNDYRSALNLWMRDRKLTPQKMAESRISHLLNDYKAWSVKNNTNAIGDGPFWTTVKEMIAESGAQNKFSKTVTVQRNSGKEKVILSSSAKSAEEQLDKAITQRIDAKQKFKQIEAYTKLVIKGTKPSFILTGDPGLGKSFSISKVLQSEGMVRGEDYEIFKGDIASAVNLYKILYEYNKPDFIVVLDDNDEILKDAAAINILKGALESGKDEPRTISYYSQRMPKDESGKDRIPTKFEYVGKMIFISNKYLRDLPSALKSRAFKTELDLNPEEIVEHISEIAYNISDLQGVPHSIIKECLKFMEEIAPVIGKFDIRSFTDVVANRLTGHKNWKAWAYSSIKQSYGLS